MTKTAFITKMNSIKIYLDNYKYYYPLSYAVSKFLPPKHVELFIKFFKEFTYLKLGNVYPNELIDNFGDICSIKILIIDSFEEEMIRSGAYKLDK